MAAGGPRRRVAIIGAGWAGLSTAVLACEAGFDVEVFEMSPTFGGRARTVERGGWHLDNGQHILVGAYRRTLDMMRRVGVDPAQVLLRRPLSLTLPDGHGLRMGAGRPSLAFAAAVWRHPDWRLSESLSLLAKAAAWRLKGFRCDPSLDVRRLCAGMPRAVMRDLIEPLCVAALNTPAHRASASVFLRVLRDALFAGPGAADLLLPRVPMGALLPDAAVAWLRTRGVPMRGSRRVTRLSREGAGWQVEGGRFDSVVLAAAARECARLAESFAPDWSRKAGSLEVLPIATVWLRSSGTVLPEPMHLLAADDERAPAQFVFDLGRLAPTASAAGQDASDRRGLMAFVISGADRWAEAGIDATAKVVAEQARTALGRHLRGPLEVVHAAIERRATFACTPGLARPPTHVSEGLLAAGDFVDGPYPATLEGAVRSAHDVVGALTSAREA